MADGTPGTGRGSAGSGTSRLRLRVRAPIDERLRRRLPRVDGRTTRADAAAPGRVFRGPIGRRGLVCLAIAGMAAYGVDSKPVARIAGTEVVATRVLVLSDRSGSMGGTEETLANQKAAALAAGIGMVAELETAGFGFSPSGSEQNALRTLERALPGLDVDAVYLFSDFDNQTGSLDDSDTDGYNRLLALGGNIYFLAKIGATDGRSFQQMASSMTGMSEEEYRRSRNVADARP